MYMFFCMSSLRYCSQIPHIAEGSLRDNVIFGQEPNEDRYREALHAASLENDLKMFPQQDQAEEYLIFIIII